MGLMSLPALAIGSDETSIANAAFQFMISDVVYDGAENTVGIIPGDDVIPIGTYGAVALDIGADEVMDAIEASDNETGYNTAVLALAGLPDVEAGHIRVGTVTVTSSEGSFTLGGTAFDTYGVTVAFHDGSVIYPWGDAEIPVGTNETKVNAYNWNEIVNNLNSVVDDLILSRGDGQVFPGTDHTAEQATDIDDAMQALRHQLAHALGETYWYTAPAGSLKAHTHVVGQGGLIPWGSLGASNARLITLHPIYPGGLITNSLRGAGASGNNNITVTNVVDVVSYVGRHAYAGSSAQTSLMDTYIALRFTLPIDFGAWATTNAIQIEYKTDSVLSTDCHVDVYLYKSGNGNIITNSENSVNVNWSNISLSAASLGSWSAGDIIELYLKLESRNSNAARIGRIVFSYTS